MNKLTIEKLSAYLPYAVKILRPDKRTILELKGLVGNLLIFQEEHKDYETLGYITHNKPILRPLSDYIDINSDAMQELNCDISTQIQINELSTKYIGVGDLYYSTVELCLMNHIDIFGLVEKGLAIPYES